MFAVIPALAGLVGGRSAFPVVLVFAGLLTLGTLGKCAATNLRQLGADAQIKQQHAEDAVRERDTSDRQRLADSELARIDQENLDRFRNIDAWAATVEQRIHSIEGRQAVPGECLPGCKPPKVEGLGK